MTVPVRCVTRGPGFHWFGYYDKWAFDPTDRFLLRLQVGFEGRMPEPEDRVTIGMIDLEDGDLWIPIGESRAWCWQQGCMLQWLPGSASRVIWNDREGDRFISRIVDVSSGQRRTVQSPVYSVSPDGCWAVTPDFRRINDMRPGYGYAGLPDPHADELTPEETGIWRVDLETGACQLLVSVADVARRPWPGGDFSKAKHYFNHLLINPDGTRFEFLHRWYQPGATKFRTRMFTCKPDGSDLRVVSESGHGSHFIWKDPSTILVYCADSGAGRMSLIDVLTRELEVIDSPDLPSRDGHFSFLPGHDQRILLTDSSGAFGKKRDLDVALFDLERRAVRRIGTFRQPTEYEGPQRVDLHPRASRGGQLVAIDSAHERGRQIYLLDLTGA